MKEAHFPYIRTIKEAYFPYIHTIKEAYFPYIHTIKEAYFPYIHTIKEAYFLKYIEQIEVPCVFPCKMYVIQCNAKRLGIS